MVRAPSAIAGSTTERKPSTPEDGMAPSVTANSRISRMPLQNVGMLCPTRTSAIRTRSSFVSRRTAITMPTGNPIPTATSSALPAR